MPARTADGSLVPLAEQDRERWNRASSRRASRSITDALAAGAARARTNSRRRSPPSTTRRRRAEDTDWPQILALYELLERIAPNPMVTLNHAVAVAMVQGPRAGLELLSTLDDDTASRSTTASTQSARTCWRWPATDAAARIELPGAARRTTSLPERRYLEARAAGLIHEQ